MTDISNIGSVRTLVKLSRQKGLMDVVLSPGSRNAPFIMSFAAIPDFNCISVVDERSAAFVALGIAQQKQTPVLLCCTSGSAMLNYASAIAEAYYQRVPLVVISADRPKEWIDQGEGQSMRQARFFEGIVAKSFELCHEQSENDAWLNRRFVNEALELAISQHRPVHINVPLSEPLYQLMTADLDAIVKEIRISGRSNEVAHSDFIRLEETWQKSARILILASQMRESAGLLEQLVLLNSDPRISIVTETTANLYHFGFVTSIDRTIERFLGSDAEHQYVPTLLITVGENLISKKLKSFLRKHKDQVIHHWHFGDEVMDTFQSLTELIASPPAALMAALRSSNADASSDFGTLWKKQFFLAEQRHNEFLEATRFSDLKAFDLILDHLPEGWQLQMGNSSVVRYVQLFNQLSGVRYFGNRGVSGIEGSTSTAVGAALASDSPVLLISGDHSFRYDANGLSIPVVPSNLRIIIVNNGGGNIFRIIEGPELNEISERFIEVENQQSIENLVKHHGVAYRSAKNQVELQTELEKLFGLETSECIVLEVFTPRVDSPEILKNYFKYLKNGNA